MNVNVILFTIALTISVYGVSRILFIRYKHPLLNPVVVSTAVIIAILWLCQLSWTDYQPGKELMTWLLGPATVGLALPLYNNRVLLRTFAIPLCLGILAGTCATMAAALWIGHLADLAPTILRSLAPKSVTAPIAIEIATLTGGNPALAVAFVVTTGMIGAMIGPLLLTRMGIIHPVARGVALGTTAHGQGTAMALLEGETQGAMAGIAMALTAVSTSLIAPAYIPFRLKVVGAGG